MNKGKAPTENKPIKMEADIEECLHIEFEFNQRALLKVLKKVKPWQTNLGAKVFHFTHREGPSEDEAAFKAGSD